MAKTDRSEAELDRLFAEATVPTPSEALLARVMADADAVLNERRIAQTTVPVAPGGWFRSILTGIGGAPALAGLATATVAGIWIGYVQPGSVGDLTAEFGAAEASYDLGDFMPGFDAVLEEG